MSTSICLLRWILNSHGNYYLEAVSNLQVCMLANLSTIITRHVFEKFNSHQLNWQSKLKYSIEWISRHQFASVWKWFLMNQINERQKAPTNYNWILSEWKFKVSSWWKRNKHWTLLIKNVRFIWIIYELWPFRLSSNSGESCLLCLSFHPLPVRKSVAEKSATTKGIKSHLNAPMYWHHSAVKIFFLWYFLHVADFHQHVLVDTFFLVH